MLVPLGESATIRNAETICESLLAAFDEHGDVELDASAVVEADLSLIQLVAAARVHAARSGRRFALCAPANAALEALLRRGGFLTAPSPADRAFWLGEEQGR